MQIKIPLWSQLFVSRTLLVQYLTPLLCSVRSSPLEVFLGKVILKICSKFTGEHPCQSMISIKLLCNFIEITFQDGFSLVDLLHISEHLFIRTPMNGYFWILFLFTETIAISTHYGKSVVPLSLHLVIREWS